ncbi:MAG TPA: FtsW/RodA/SpoVE family cell cycle protein [Acetivibrio sp.]|nr:rod shape-determining protein RodA [Clostridium sp.]HOQ36436.1 FtsW/RodA/SpoVE family cell cycle protein [Acetivibrio sp.]
MYIVEKTKNFNFFKSFDYILFLEIIILSVIGCFVARSAVNTFSTSRKMMIVHIGCLAVGALLAVLISFLDYKDFKIPGILFYFFTIALLVLVLFIGTGEDLGSRNRLVFMGFTFQPSELAKISVVIVGSIFLDRIYNGEKNKAANIIKFVVYSSIPVLLIVVQKDFGVVAVFLCALFIMVFFCGLRYKYIFMMLGAGVLTAPFVWFFLLNDKRRDRIRVFLNPNLDPLDAGWNVIRSKMAIGSGKIFGKGLFKGIQTQNSMVPVKESDFIFSVVGEELGFVGAVVILLLVFLILMRFLNIAKNARDTYGSFLVIGLGSFFAVNFIENIGMSIGLLPVTGIPLPFISVGGSAMLTNMLSVGIILSVSARRHRGRFLT